MSTGLEDSLDLVIACMEKTENSVTPDEIAAETGIGRDELETVIEEGRRRGDFYRSGDGLRTTHRTYDQTQFKITTTTAEVHQLEPSKKKELGLDRLQRKLEKQNSLQPEEMEDDKIYGLHDEGGKGFVDGVIAGEFDAEEGMHKGSVVITYPGDGYCIASAWKPPLPATIKETKQQILQEESNLELIPLPNTQQIIQETMEELL